MNITKTFKDKLKTRLDPSSTRLFGKKLKSLDCKKRTKGDRKEIPTMIDLTLIVDTEVGEVTTEFGIDEKVLEKSLTETSALLFLETRMQLHMEREIINAAIGR